MVQWPTSRSFPNIENGFYELLERNLLYVGSQNSWIQEHVTEAIVSESRSIEVLSNLFVGVESASSDTRRNEALAENLFKSKGHFALKKVDFRLLSANFD